MYVRTINRVEELMTELLALPAAPPSMRGSRW